MHLRHATPPFCTAYKAFLLSHALCASAYADDSTMHKLMHSRVSYPQSRTVNEMSANAHSKLHEPMKRLINNFPHDSQRVLSEGIS